MTDDDERGETMPRGRPNRPADPWAHWVLGREGITGPDTDDQRRTLHAIRDRVVEGAQIRSGDTVLDVGTGDGLIGFAALRRVGPSGRVVFSDISRELLDHCRTNAVAAGAEDRCEFVLASTDDLHAIGDETIDAVTSRSVLIYVREKKRAFDEFFRVLRPAGRVSLFEPINSFLRPEPDDRFLGYDVAPVRELAAKLKRVRASFQPPDDPMLDFDERDLLRFAEASGFATARMQVELVVDARPRSSGHEWDEFVRMSPNPKLPPLGELLELALTAPERRRFERHLAPLVREGVGEHRAATAYLSAVKPAR